METQLIEADLTHALPSRNRRFLHDGMIGIAAIA